MKAHSKKKKKTGKTVCTRSNQKRSLYGIVSVNYSNHTHTQQLCMHASGQNCGATYKIRISPHTHFWEGVWGHALQPAVAQEFNYICNPYMT